MEIKDETIEAALRVLNSSTHARAKAAHEYGQDQLKVILAKEALASNAKTADERKNEALTSQAYLTALEEHRKVAEVYFEARDKREAADAILRAWQTSSADNRAMGRVQ